MSIHPTGHILLRLTNNAEYDSQQPIPDLFGFAGVSTKFYPDMIAVIFPGDKAE
jgi:hypothetical protein